MITDPSTGQAITYIPFSLYENTESAPVALRVTPQSATDVLEVSDAPEVTVWARIGAGAWFDLSSNPVSLSPYFESFLDFEIKAIAAASVPGLSRIELFLGVRRSGAAAWLA